jgi:hypothetical protein
MFLTDGAQQKCRTGLKHRERVDHRVHAAFCAGEVLQQI